MRRPTAIAASILMTSLSAACAEMPSSHVVNTRLAANEAATPYETCGGASSDAYTGIASRGDCAKIAQQLHGLNEVTVEFSDRYQAVAVPIQVYTMSWITHVDFVLPDGRLLGATPFGVRIRNWSPAIHSVRYTFHGDAEKVLGFALSQVGKPYDYVGLSGYALHIGFLHQPGSWFCSGLVQAAALKGGVNLSGRSPHMTSPVQIRDSHLLTKVDQTRTYLAQRDEEQPTAAQAAYVPPPPAPADAPTPIAYQPVRAQLAPALAPYPSIRSTPTAAAYELRGMETVTSPGG